RRASSAWAVAALPYPRPKRDGLSWPSPARRCFTTEARRSLAVDEDVVVARVANVRDGRGAQEAEVEPGSSGADGRGIDVLVRDQNHAVEAEREGSGREIGVEGDLGPP